MSRTFKVMELIIKELWFVFPGGEYGFRFSPKLGTKGVVL